MHGGFYFSTFAFLWDLVKALANGLGQMWSSVTYSLDYLVASKRCTNAFFFLPVTVISNILDGEISFSLGL